MSVCMTFCLPLLFKSFLAKLSSLLTLEGLAYSQKKARARLVASGTIHYVQDSAYAKEGREGVSVYEETI